MIESRRKMPRAPSGKVSASRAKRQSENDGDIVRFNWGDYSSTVFTFFYDLLERGRFVDVRLACEGHIIGCHRIILSACSNYFEEILKNQDDKMTILIGGVKFWELHALVMFMYTGEAVVRRDLVDDLLTAAGILQVKGLINVNPYRSLENATKVKSKPRPIVKFENYCMSSPTSGALMPPNYIANNGNGTKQLEFVNIKKEKIDDEDDSDNFHALLPNEVPNPAFVGSFNLANIKSEPMQTDEENNVELQNENTDELQNENIQANGSGSGDAGIADEGEKDGGDCFPDVANGENENLAHTPPVKLSSRMKYPADVREAAVKDMLNGMLLDECFLKYNVPKKTLSNWKSKRTHQLKLQKNKEKKINDSPPGPSLYTPPTRQRQPYILNPYSLPPVEGKSREEHLKNAAKLVVHEVTNIKNAASHYGIPRTTLSNYMRRNGLMYLKKGACAYQSSEKDSDDNLEMPQIHAMNLSGSGYEDMDVVKARNSDSQLLMA